MDEICRILSSDEFRRRLCPKLPPRVAVEEVLGRTWERARNNMPTDGDHVAGLLRVAANIARDDLKAETRRRRRERQVGSRHCGDETCANDPSDTQATEAHDEAVHDVGPGRALERREGRRAIVNAVRKACLPRNHRRALWAWMRGRLDEWAARHRVNRATARVWAKRAREVLRAQLVAAGVGPDP